MVDPDHRRLLEHEAREPHAADAVDVGDDDRPVHQEEAVDARHVPHAQCGVGLGGAVADPVQRDGVDPHRRVVDDPGAVEVLLLGPVDLTARGLLYLGGGERRRRTAGSVEYDHREFRSPR